MWSAATNLDLRAFEYKFVVVGPFGVRWEDGWNRQFMVFQPSALPVGLKVQKPRTHPPAMTRRGSILPVECGQLPTLLATAVSPPVSPKKGDHSTSTGLL